MNNLQKRFALFLIGCIGTRLLFVYIAKHVSLKYLPYLGYLALLPAIGFMYIYIFGARNTGAEVFGEKIWWNNLRPLHAVFYTMFAIAAIMGNRNAWIWLLLDLLLGLVSFFIFHYKNGDFSKLSL
jgi:hypothetical protein